MAMFAGVRELFTGIAGLFGVRQSLMGAVGVVGFVGVVGVGCQVAGSGELRSYLAASDSACTSAREVLTEALEVVGSSNDSDLVKAVQVRLHALDTVRACNHALVSFNANSDEKEVAGNIRGFADSLASLAGSSVYPLADKVKKRAVPISMVIVRGDELIDAEKQRQFLREAGPGVIALLRVLKEDAPALHEIIAFPLVRKRDAAFARFVDLGFRFSELARSRISDPRVNELLGEMNSLRAGVSLPPGVKKLPDITPEESSVAENASETDVDTLAALVKEARQQAALLRRLKQQTDIHAERMRKYTQVLAAAADSMQSLLDKAEGRKTDPDLQVEELYRQVAWLVRLNRAYREIKND
ncbi:MAG TPA: hypothetical protein ENJ06_00965 [Phycisphaeraceae bacterium]|nr:hypothetical protein [Phycisphaeraceae bacterium]